MRWVALMLLGSLSLGAASAVADDDPSTARDQATTLTPAVSKGQKRPTEQIKRVVRSEREWQRRLTRPQFQSMRLKGTEPAFTGRYWNNHAEGLYQCAACELMLFSSAAKFDSGTGWPSFWGALSDKRYKTEIDLSEGAPRVEVLCAGCDSHLGHVFQDGPAPTGLRFCINSVALKFLTEAELRRQEEARASESETTTATAPARNEKPLGPGERRVEFK